MEVLRRGGVSTQALTSCLTPYPLFFLFSSRSLFNFILYYFIYFVFDLIRHGIKLNILERKAVPNNTTVGMEAPGNNFILLFYYFIILLFYYFIILLFYYFFVLLFYCFIVLLFYCFIVLLFYCFIVLLFYYSIVSILTFHFNLVIFRTITDTLRA